MSNLFAWRSTGAPYALGRDRTPYIDVREHLGIRGE